MDGIVLDSTVVGLFLFAAFAGGFASGLAGFAMGFVVSGIWLHILTPLQTTTLVVGYGLLTQGYGVWKLKHAVVWRSIAPFIIGGAAGVPIGTLLLTYIDPAYLRAGVGVLLVIYGGYGLAQPKLKPVAGGVAADTGIGFANGMLAGLTGLPGFIITIWCLAEGFAARHLPAGHAGRHRDECRGAGHRRRPDDADTAIVRARPAGHGGGPVARIQALWKA
jgi:hypothetical protein